MKNKILSVIIVSIIFVLSIPMVIFATNEDVTLEKVELKVVTDKDSYDIGEEVKATVKWEKEAESLGFKVNYDKEKLEFVSISVGKNFYNADTAGEILCNWYSAEGNTKTNIEIVFKSKVSGQAKIDVSNAKGFAWVSDTIDTSKKKYSYLGKTLEVKEVQTPIPEEPSGEQPSQTPQTPSEEKPANKEEVKIDKTTAGGKIPHAGSGTTVVFAIVLIAVISIIAFIKYRELYEIQ